MCIRFSCESRVFAERKSCILLQGPANGVLVWRASRPSSRNGARMPCRFCEWLRGHVMLTGTANMLTILASLTPIPTTTTALINHTS